jgi:catechol 2,3-dioxygenase-like lactoylglutathione lyase family enzyme
MNILGLESLVFGVEDIGAAIRMAEAYGLVRREGAIGGPGVFEAQDGSAIDIRRADDPSLPPAVGPGPTIREVVYAVADTATLEAIATELAKDRLVTVDPAGAVHSTDFDGYAITFRLAAQRRAVMPDIVTVNAPGRAEGRGVNVCAAVYEDLPRPVTLSHVVLYTRNRQKARAFNEDRLGFRTVDEFIGVGPFMRPKGLIDHHCLFLVQAGTLFSSGEMGMNHFTFHFAGPSQMLKRGWEMVNRGFKSAWGPGRHMLGSNYFWYFESPFGGVMELDADMDRHDDAWIPRVVEPTADVGQIFLFQAVPVDLNVDAKTPAKTVEPA